MSRVYWHAQGREAELLGRERAWLDHLASGPAKAAWNLDSPFNELESAVLIASMIPNNKADYLHNSMRAAMRQDEINKAYYSQAPRNTRSFAEQPNHDMERDFIKSLKIRLGGHGIGDNVIRIADHDLNIWHLNLNTAIAAGSTPIQLAAHIHARCELHCFIEGSHRWWVADVIEEGLTIGMYRQGMGWDSVQELLTETSDGPVVLSYSITESFPGVHVTDWVPDPTVVPEDYSLEEWEIKDPEEKEEASWDQWYGLPDEQKWDLAIAGLRAKRPWALLSPETIDEPFGDGLTVYDVLAPDKEDRVRRAYESSASDKDVARVE